MTSSQHAYEVRPRKDRRGLDLISDALPFGRLNAANNPFTFDVTKSRGDVGQ